VSGVKNVEFHNDPFGCLNRFADGSDAPNGCRIGSFTTTSLFGRYRWTKELEVFGSVQNLFDRVAPLDPQTYGAYRFNVAFHMPGAIGRQFSVGARYTFK
jgi:iron complex outermembrane receptor protein